jgi:hypothetical protein
MMRLIATSAFLFASSAFARQALLANGAEPRQRLPLTRRKQRRRFVSIFASRNPSSTSADSDQSGRY